MNLVKIKRLITRVCIAAILLSAWMLPAGGQPASAEVEKIVKVAAGGYISLGLTNAGNVYVWGGASDQNQGTGHRYGGPYPVKIDGLSNVKDIDAGLKHAVALLQNGTVWAWGINQNSAYQLGNNTAEEALLPVQVLQEEGGEIIPLDHVAKISVGANYALALKDEDADGNTDSLWSWGENFGGQLGNGLETVMVAGPVQLDENTELTGIKDIVASFDTAYALDYSGTMYAWGSNFYGKLGKGITYDSYIPSTQKGIYAEAIAGPGFDDTQSIVSRIFGGSLASHAFFQTVTGAVYGFGSNYHDEINPDLGNTVTSPQEIDSLNGISISDISAGYDHTLILDTDGYVYGLGETSQGQLLTPNAGLKGRLDALSNIVSIEAGHDNADSWSLVVNGSGQVYAFGQNNASRLGKVGDGSVLTATLVSDIGTTYGTTVSGRLVYSYNQQPAEGIELKLKVDEFGELYTTTDSTGNFEFHGVVRYDEEDYVIETRTGEDDLSIDVHVQDEPISLGDVEYTPSWVPKQMEFIDDDNLNGFINGSLIWSGNYGVLNKAVYSAYFESASGDNLGMAGESLFSVDNNEYPQEINFNHVEIPDNSVYLRLVVESKDPTETCFGTKCFLPTKLLLLDGPTEIPRKLSIESTDEGDLMVKWLPPADESKFAQYEVVKINSEGYYYSENILGTYEVGSSNYEYLYPSLGYYDYRVFLRVRDSNGVISWRIPINYDVPLGSEEPGETQGPKMIRFIDENDEAGIIEGTVIFEAMSTPAEYQIVLLDQNNNWVVTLKSVAEVTGTVRVVVPASSLTPEAKRIGVMADEDDTTLSTLAIWDSSGLKQMDTDPNADELGGELRWSAFPTDSRIAAYKAYIVDMDADTAGVPITGAITHLSEKTVSIPANTSIPADADKIAIVGLTAGGEPISWAAIDIADMGPVEMSIGLYQSKLKAWISPEDPFDMVDVISFGARKKYDITGDGSFNTEDFKLLLKLIDPVYPMLVY